ncbi:hypothetical protein N8077_04285, partial [Myxococcota bacterium]|nr:hypothetical protein [Myxococcota bacterium]
MTDEPDFNRIILEQLAGLVTQSLIDKIESGEATAADLSAAIKLLKDQGITAAPKATANLIETLEDEE